MERVGFGPRCALVEAGRRQAESATDIAHDRATVPLPSIVRAGLEKQPRDLELSPWLKGRYGTAIGRAVHGVLQTVPLASGDGLDAAAVAQALAEDVPDAIPEITSAARAALTHWSSSARPLDPTGERPTSAPRSTTPSSRATSTCSTATTTDSSSSTYKTHQDAGPVALAAYETQLGVYARAIADATEEPVVRSVLRSSLPPDGAVTHQISHQH